MQSHGRLIITWGNIGFMDYAENFKGSKNYTYAENKKSEETNMQKLILDIFDKVNIGIPDLTEMEQDLTEQIESILDAMLNQIPEEYHDDIGRHVFEVSGLAERKGFELGVKYMVKLLMECLSS